MEHSYYRAVKERLDLARDIDLREHANSKKRHQNDWFVKAAKELDMDLDEHSKYPLSNPYRSSLFEDNIHRRGVTPTLPNSVENFSF